jgi:hypothetical protein
MAIQWVGRDIVCLSTDTKPTNVPVNTKAFETNTGATYRFNGTAWIVESGGGGGGGGFSAGGAIFKSGTGSQTVFTIAHGLTSTPDVYFALPTNTAARGDISYSVDATNITLTYPIAPASGTNNLSYVWGAGYTNVALSTFTASSATTLTNKTIDFDTNTLTNNQQPYTFLIYPFGALNFKVRSGATGKTVYTSNNPTTADALGALEYCRDQLAAVSPGGLVVLTAGYYPLSATFTLTGGTHQLQKYKGPGDGTSSGPLAQIRALGDFPAITLNGATNPINGVGLDGLYLSHNTAGYTSGLIRILDGAVENTLRNLAFYDFGRNAGDAIKIEILNTTSVKAQYQNRILNCTVRGMDNFISVNNQAVAATHGTFMSTIDISNCNVWNSKRILNMAGASGAQVLDMHFHRVNFQYSAANAVAAGQGIFNYDSAVSCWLHRHSFCEVWDITGPGINYANLGNTTELELTNCAPTSRLGGSGLSVAKPKILIVDSYRWRQPIPEQYGELFGSYTSGASVHGTGLLFGTSLVGTAVQASDAKGLYVTQATGTTADTSVGFKKGPGMYRRDQNPYLRCVGGVNNTSVGRLYFGWHSLGTILGSDTPLATTDSGFLIGFRGTTDTTYKIFHNNGGGGAMTVLDTGVALSTSVDQILTLTADTAAYTWSINDSTPVSVSTGTLPSTTAALMFHWIVQNNTTTSVTGSFRNVCMKLRASV